RRKTASLNNSNISFQFLKAIGHASATFSIPNMSITMIRHHLATAIPLEERHRDARFPPPTSDDAEKCIMRRRCWIQGSAMLSNGWKARSNE
ncbi:hypothetical protein, partial [Escherichia coli]|uniref:hypothetical protein n=1 Tax=Escherichia coli TaxID=562 RepID=UPI002283783A